MRITIKWKDSNIKPTKPNMYPHMIVSVWSIWPSASKPDTKAVRTFHYLLDYVREPHVLQISYARYKLSVLVQMARHQQSPQIVEVAQSCMTSRTRASLIAKYGVYYRHLLLKLRLNFKKRRNSAKDRNGVGRCADARDWGRLVD